MAPTGDVSNELVSKFIESISSKYDLEEDELIAEWEKSLRLSAKKGAGKGKKAAANGAVKKAAGKGKSGKAKKATKDEDDDEEEELRPVPDEVLESSNVASLKEFCRARGLRVTGNKAALIARLRGEDEKAAAPKKGAGKAKKVVSDKQAKKIEEKSTVLEKLKKEVPKQPIRRNEFGNFVHAETSLVIRREDQKAVGHQEDDGSVRALNKEDIQNCKKFNIEYDQLPINLDDEKRDDEEVIDDEEEEEEELEGSEEVEEEVEEEEE